MSRGLPRGLQAACAGIAACGRCEPYLSALEEAAGEVGSFYAEPKARQNLVKAICLNLFNQKKYPFFMLNEQYGLAIHPNTFTREKQKFCFALARALHLTP